MKNTNLNIQLTHDDQGYPQAKVASPYELLGDYLMQDVQSNPAGCLELIAIVDEIQKGKKEKWEGIGNAFNLTLTKSTALIKSEFGDIQSSSEVPLEIFHEALSKWLELVKSK